MRHILRLTLLGLLSWAIPFAAAIPFFDRTGALAIPQPLFKSLMVVISGAVGVTLLTLVFRHTRPTLRSGLTVGLYWLALNLGLDLAVLVPMSGASPLSYFEDIGLRYLLIPIIAAGMGAAASGR